MRPERADDIRWNPQTGKMELLKAGQALNAAAPAPITGPAPAVQYCAPSKKVRVAFDAHQFANKRTRTVSSETRITFSDYGRMHVERRAQETWRRNGIPEYALNDELLQQVLVNYLEKRLYVRPDPADDIPTHLTKVELHAKQCIPDRLDVLGELIKRQQAAEDEDERRGLRIEVQIFDTDVVMLRRGLAGLVAAIIYDSYRLGLNSVQIAQSHNLKPPHIRQVLKRVAETHHEMLGAEITTKPRGPREHTIKRLDRIRALRAAGTSWGEVAQQMRMTKNSLRHLRKLYLSDLEDRTTQQLQLAFEAEAELACVG